MQPPSVAIRATPIRVANRFDRGAHVLERGVVTRARLDCNFDGKRNDPPTLGSLGDLCRVHDRPDHIGVGAAVRVPRLRQHGDGALLANLKRAVHRHADKREVRIRRQPLRFRHVDAAGEIRIDCLNAAAIERAFRGRAVVESDHAYVDIRALQDPATVTFGEEDVAAALDAFKNPAICAAANSLRREEPNAADSPRRDGCHRPLEPVTAQIGLAGQSPVVDAASSVHVLVAQSSSHLLPPRTADCPR